MNLLETLLMNRILLKKAVGLAFRNIVKRTFNLSKAAIEEARKIQLLKTKNFHWIKSDDIRELESEAVKKIKEEASNHAGKKWNRKNSMFEEIRHVKDRMISKLLFQIQQISSTTKL